jgi:hypothetical protein
MTRAIPKTCLCCGSDFFAGSHLAKWCSSRCTMRAYLRRRRGAPEADAGVRLIAPQVVQPEILDDPDELPPAWGDAAQGPAAAALAPFAYDGHQVRVITDEQGMPWFVAADVCAVLGIATEQTRRLDDDEKGLRSMQTPGGTQSMTTVNESGLYSLILGSRKPEARAFKRWVTHDVLPAIRRTGSYALPGATPPPLPHPHGVVVYAPTEEAAAKLWCKTLQAAASLAIWAQFKQSPPSGNRMAEVDGYTWVQSA